MDALKNREFDGQVRVGGLRYPALYLRWRGKNAPKG